MAVRVEASTNLEAGDHLTREEFHRRYLARPDIKKAELIDGVVYVPSPVRRDPCTASRTDSSWAGWHSTLAVRPTSDCWYNTTVFLDGQAEVQPDAFLWRPALGGPRLTEDGYHRGRRRSSSSKSPPVQPPMTSM